ncbi:hypothetical protein DPMN_158763 [Dreissena polymorpha]|uniref:Uncharacterized protein n=1 Tax=Dreissena polymorpha TaxID=45954 RepID=A0A9D4EJQ1_DREPO|nr:hypothetical protein DPMN_158763 [Dreissena polymorpha]
MNADMFPEIRGGDKALATLVTDVPPLTVVLHVLVSNCLRLEPLGTHLALVLSHF